MKNWPVPTARVEGLEKRQLLSAPVLPSGIPTGTGHLFVVTAAPFNAVGDGSTDDTTAIQNAINTCANATTDNGVTKGGTVEIPSGTFEFTHLNMASNVILQLDSGAVLQAFGQSVVGTTNNNLIFCNNISNFEVIGLGSGASQGDIDGNGGTWYPSNAGPNLILMGNCSKVLFQNISITNSPHEHIACNNGNNNVTMNNVTVNAPASSPNTDGIDPKGSDWLIEFCTISDGDDDIAPKPSSAFCNNISVQSCTILFGHGISIGSGTTDGINNFTVNNTTFNGTTNGLRMKANRGGGGPVTNVTYSNITMTGVEFPILIDGYYNQNNNFPTNPNSDPGQKINNTSHTPTWNNITFMNITSTDTNDPNSVGAAIFALPEAPATTMIFQNVNITAAVGLEMNHVRGVTFDSNTHFTALHGPDLLGTYTYNSTTNVYTFTFPTPIDAQITEQGYTNQDIGTPTVPFDTSESLYDPDTGNWTIQGDGAGITGSSDQFSYTNTPVTSDTNFSAKLTGLASGGSAGVMYRASTAAGDAFAAAVQNASGTITFQFRTTSGGTIQTSGSVAGTIGADYLKVSRSGNSFSAYYSTNGTTWIQVGSSATITTIPASSSVGFAASSNSNGALAQATYSNVQLTANTGTGPTVVNAAAAVQSANGLSVNLTALGQEGGSDTGLTYTWSATTVPNGVLAPVFDSNNGLNAGKNETATLKGIGQYTFLVTIADASNQSITSSVNITVTQVLTSIVVTPSTVTVGDNATQPFSAVADDQFGNALSSQPSQFSWTLGNGSVGQIGSTSGVYTAPNSPGSATVFASANSVTSSAATVTDVAPPQVTNVVLSSSDWTSGFLSYLSGLNAANVGGYSIPTGSGQTATLPWVNLDTIKITFSQNVSVSQGSLQLFGVNPSSYSTNGFSYDSGTDTATWTLAAPFADNKLLIDLTSASITNSSNLALDGEWTDGTSAYPSGNGTAGGDFLFSFNVLPGDINQSAGVNILDTISVRNAQGSTTGTPATYNVLMDLDGSGGINIVDTIDTRNLQGSTLPAGTPSASVESVGPIVSATSLGSVSGPVVVSVPVATPVVSTPTPTPAAVAVAPAPTAVFSSTPISSSFDPWHHKRSASHGR